MSGRGVRGRRAVYNLVQQLEARRLMAAVSWDGEAGDNNWHTPANWSNNVLPTVNDDVTIDVAGTPTVTITSIGGGKREVKSLYTREKVFVNSGELSVATTATFDGVGADLQTYNGTVANGTWHAVNGAVFKSMGSTGITFRNATLASEFNATLATSVTINTRLGLSGGATLRMGGPTLRVNLVNNVSIDGQGTVVLGERYASAPFYFSSVANQTLTIGAGIDVQHVNDFLGVATQRIVNHGTLTGFGDVAPFVENYGTINTMTYYKGGLSNHGTVNEFSGVEGVLVNTGVMTGKGYIWMTLDKDVPGSTLAGITTTNADLEVHGNVTQEMLKPLAGSGNSITIYERITGGLHITSDQVTYYLRGTFEGHYRSDVLTKLSAGNNFVLRNARIGNDLNVHGSGTLEGTITFAPNAHLVVPNTTGDELTLSTAGPTTLVSEGSSSGIKFGAGARTVNVVIGNGPDQPLVVGAGVTLDGGFAQATMSRKTTLSSNFSNRIDSYGSILYTKAPIDFNVKLNNYGSIQLPANARGAFADLVQTGSFTATKSTLTVGKLSVLAPMSVTGASVVNITEPLVAATAVLSIADSVVTYLKAGATDVGAVQGALSLTRSSLTLYGTYAGATLESLALHDVDVVLTGTLVGGLTSGSPENTWTFTNGAILDGGTLNIATGPRFIPYAYTPAGATAKFRNLTLANSVTIPSAYSLSIEGSLTLLNNLQLQIGELGEAFTPSINLSSATSIEGSGTILLPIIKPFTSFRASVVAGAASAGPLALGPGITLSGTGSITGSRTVVNYGAIESSIAGFELKVSANLINHGIARSREGSQLQLLGIVDSPGQIVGVDSEISIASPLVRNGGISLTNTAFHYLIGSTASWSSLGNLSASGSVILLGGKFSAAAVDPTHVQSTEVRIFGILEGDLSVSGTDLKWALSNGGEFRNGSYTAVAPASLGFVGSGTLRNITVGSNLSIPGTFTTTIAGGMTLANTTLQVSSQVRLADAQPIGGNGQIVLSGGTIAPVSTVGSFTVPSGIIVSGHGGLGATGITLTNLGVIHPTTGVITLTGSLVNAGTILVDSAATGLTLAGSGITNTGVFAISSGTLRLAGTHTQQQVLAINRTGGTVVLGGVLNGNLALNAATGSWILDGGTLSGGRYSASDGAELVQTAATHTLVNMTLASDLVLPAKPPNAVASTITVRTGLSFENGATLRIGNGSRIGIDGPQTWSGNGSVLLGTGGAAASITTANLATTPWTVGAGIALRGAGTIGTNSTDNIVLQGPVEALGTLSFTPNLRALGTLTAPAGVVMTLAKVTLENATLAGAGTFRITSTAWTRVGGLNFNGGGALILPSSASLATLGSVSTDRFSLAFNYTGASNRTAVIAAMQAGGIVPAGLSADFHEMGLSIYELSTQGTTVFAGVTLDSTVVVAKHTYLGDTNIDGKVDSADYGGIDSMFGNNVLGPVSGDHNYDGRVNGDDYGYVDANFGAGADPVSARATKFSRPGHAALPSSIVLQRPDALAELSGSGATRGLFSERSVEAMFA